MESYITLFMDKTITGGALLNLDSTGLKELGIKNKDDRDKIKKKIKELKAHNDKEKKDMEKEKNRREKLLKKAERVINVGKKKWTQPWKQTWTEVCQNAKIDFILINLQWIRIFLRALMQTDWNNFLYNCKDFS